MDTYHESKQDEHVHNEEELLNRREYLLSLKKWSKAVIAGILVGGISSCGGSWVNASGGGWGNSGIG